MYLKEKNKQIQAVCADPQVNKTFTAEYLKWMHPVLILNESELRIRGGIRVNSKIYFLISQ